METFHLNSNAHLPCSAIRIKIFQTSGRWPNDHDLVHQLLVMTQGAASPDDLRDVVCASESLQHLAFLRVIDWEPVGLQQRIPALLPLSGHREHHPHQVPRDTEEVEEERLIIIIIDSMVWRSVFSLLTNLLIILSTDRCWLEFEVLELPGRLAKCRQQVNGVEPFRCSLMCTPTVSLTFQRY